MTRKLSLILAILFSVQAVWAHPAETGESVVVVYNTRVPESKGVAEHYAGRRNVPENQVIGLSLPTGETMSRIEFREDLQRPLLRQLEDRGLFAFHSEVQTNADGRPGPVVWNLTKSKIKYAVLCYGVPLRIAPDNRLVEKGAEELQPELRRNEAAVDTELALLPIVHTNPRLTGPIPNPMYATTNATQLHPTNGLFLVTRLDGPTAEIARGLVDKAMEAEENGLWGRAYFDLRGIEEGSYKQGDNWIGTAAEISRRFGFETVVDTKSETFPASFPMSHIGLYAGWYDGTVSGPFRQPNVEFLPGAFAYHLHSFSAETVRSATRNWVGPLLAAGATATMGTVYEPYLIGTPDLAVFFSRFLMLGFSFAEAAYASQYFLSWQTTFIGDPLYRPFARRPQELHEHLENTENPLVEWSHLRVVNLNIAGGFPMAEMVGYLETQSVTRQSAVLLEKLGDLYEGQGKPASSIHAYRQALQQEPSRQQEIRLRLALAEKLAAAGQQDASRQAYEEFLKKFPDYPGRADVLERITAAPSGE